MQKEGKQTLLLGGLLVISLIAVFAGVRLYLNAAETVKIPPGYTPYSYLRTLESADRNDDNQLNSLDYASVLNQNGEAYLVKQSKFGMEVNALERSFIIDNLGTNITQKKDAIYKDPTLGKRYAAEQVLATETKLPASVFAADDRAFNTANPLVKGATTESESTQAGGDGTGASGASSGRSIIPQVLGTVSPYTGSAGFSYPIKVPAGPGGYAPSIGISYSSGSVDDGLKQGNTDIVGVDDNGKAVNEAPYKLRSQYTPSYAGYGFSLSGAGAIMREDRGEKTVPSLKGEPYHRFIVSLPSGVSVQLRYNTTTDTWVSIPQGFVKIERHGQPEIKKDSRFNFALVDPNPWVITTSDGTRYYFGEEDLGARISNTGMINSPSQNLAVDRTARGETTAIKQVHHVLTTGGGIYNEFDVADLCKGDSVNEPCRNKISNNKPALLVTKWLLKRIETSDGKAINYSYENYQKVYGQYYKKDWGTDLSVVTVDSYLSKIEWNDAKYRVLFKPEPIKKDKDGQDELRIDHGGTQFLSPTRLASIDVETQKPSATGYSLMRRYTVEYSNADDVMVGGTKNPWNASLVKSLREFGYDGATTTSPITFQYKQLAFDRGVSGSTIYLDTINNGMGGATTYAYQPFQGQYAAPDGDARGGLKRVRVIEKKVVDKTTNNRSYKETYNYFNSQKGFAERIRGENLSGREFLGHNQVEVKTFDFNSDKLLAHTLTRFNQAIGNDKCTEPSLAKGQVAEQIVYNDLPSGTIEAKKTKTTYNYRLLTPDKSGDPVIVQDGLDPATKQCSGADINQPYFVYGKSTVTTVNEPQDGNFVPNGLEKVLSPEGKPVATRTSASQTLSVDLFGNTIKAVSLGETDANGKDISSKDNRYSYGYYLSGNPYWLNNLSYASYSSNKPDCAYSDTSCQWGRSNMWYDVFYGDFTNVKIEAQRPKIGAVTQTQSVLDDTTTSFASQEYLRLSDKSEDHDTNAGNDSTDVRLGGVTKTYGPNPELKLATMHLNNVAHEITLLSQTTYDSFFKTMVTETENAKGFKTKFDEFNYELQVPQVIQTQTNVNPVRFATAKATFDPLGRSITSFGPDPKDPTKTLPYPSSVAHYFDRGDTGLVVRGMKLVSLTTDGKPHYMASDSFYDGLGKVKQAQVLSKKIVLDPKATQPVVATRRIVTDALYNALGQQAESYEVQTADPVTLVDNRISSVQPQMVTIDHRVLAKTSYDTLNRPVEAVAYDVDNTSTLTTKTFFQVNAVKTVSPKNVISIATSDSLGRSVNGLTIDPTNGQHLLTTNVYGAEMIDKPTQTTYTSLKPLSGGDTTTATVKYDKAGRVVFQDEPSLGTFEFAYDILGNKLLESRPGRKDVMYAYDILGRNIKVIYPNEATGELYKNSSPRDTDFTYDNGENALGKLTSVVDHNGKEEYSYDVLGRQVSTKKTIKSKSYTSATQYNDISQPLLVQYPNGKKLTTVYNEEGTATSTLLDGKEIAMNPMIDKFGNSYQSSFVLGTSTYVNRTTHDTMGRLTQIGVAKQAGGQIYYQQLKYNNLSDLTNVTESTYKDGKEAKVDYAYVYDSYSRLVNAQSSLYTTSYSYDPFGRMYAKNEDQNITLAFNSSFPFFAPKSITKPAVVITPPPTKNTATPTPDIKTQLPTDIPPSATATPTPSLTSTPTPTPTVVLPTNSFPTSEPTPSTKPQAFNSKKNGRVAGVNTGGTTATYEFVYDQNNGNMLEDDKHCFSYNRLNQLVTMRIKKDSSQRCTLGAQFKKLIYFYYDASRTLVLQEEYAPGNDNKPVKQTYYIGSYEEEYTN